MFFFVRYIKTMSVFLLVVKNKFSVIDMYYIHVLMI